ncbi:MAG: hypothetical protein IKI95_06340 [Clostridia bacterium]|nr:hypothetical protein [Clostridia bacterium]
MIYKKCPMCENSHIPEEDDMCFSCRTKVEKIKSGKVLIVNPIVDNNNNEKTKYEKDFKKEKIELNDLIDEIKNQKYAKDFRSWTKDDEINFKNEYIIVRRFASSNKWVGIPHKSEMQKMWSIICDIKKDFTNLPNFKKLENHFDIKITPVSKGTFSGCMGIRFYNMSREPENILFIKILRFIFQ